MADRWEAFTPRETMNIHHGLRVVLAHPFQLPLDEQDEFRKLADEIWDRHAAISAAHHPPPKELI